MLWIPSQGTRPALISIAAITVAKLMSEGTQECKIAVRRKKPPAPTSPAVVAVISTPCHMHQTSSIEDIRANTIIAIDFVTRQQKEI
jgi:hypothetical protein